MTGERMLLHDKLWILKEESKIEAENLADKLGVSKIIAQLLINRGINSIDEAKAFFSSGQGCLQHSSIPAFEIDMELSVKDIGFELIEGLREFCYGDLKPLFLYKKIIVDSVNFFGENNEHLKLLVQDKNRVFDCIGMNLGIHNSTLSKGEKIDLVFTLDVYSFKGIETIRLNLLDIRRRCEEGYKESELINNYYKSFPNIFKAFDFKQREFMLENILDFRNIEDRAGYIIETIDFNNSNIILINTIEGLIEFSLSMDGTGYADNLHTVSFNIPETTGKNAIVVNPILSNLHIEKYDNIYLYDMPIMKEQINMLMGINMDTKIHFLYNEGDRKPIKVFFDSVIPYREDLVEVYKYLKGHSNNKKYIYKDLTNNLLNMNLTKLNLCLDILSDANLICYNIEEELNIDLLPPPKKKLDISATQLFKRITRIKEDFKNLSELLFTINLKAKVKNESD
jgi:single-stranded-DNA-specific exonuclease